MQERINRVGCFKYSNSISLGYSSQTKLPVKVDLTLLKDKSESGVVIPVPAELVNRLVCKELTMLYLVVFVINVNSWY